MTQSGDPKAKRLLRMLFLLQSGHRYDISRLAAEMAVSRRTIFRDVATLKAVGVPVRFDDETHSLVMAPKSTDGVRRMQYGDLALVLLGARSSIRNDLRGAGEELESAIRGLIESLEVDLRDSMSGLLNRVVVDASPPSHPSSPKPDVVVAVATGLSYERRVYLIVEDSTRNVEWRFRFSPYQLRLQDEGWTALGASELHEKACLVNLAHVQRAAVTDETYAVPLTLPSDEDLERL